jgi:hypothetical protein
MRRFLAGKVSVVEDRKMDGYYEEGEKYRNKRNYVPLVRPTSPSYVLRPPRTSYVPLVRPTSPSYVLGAMRRYLAGKAGRC